jgi:hypothetical protein
MWSVSAITLFSLTRRVSCFLLTFNADTHFGCVSLVTHACDVPRFVRLSCRRRNSSLRRPLQSVAFARLPTRVPDQCRLRVASLRRTGRYLGRFASSANDFSHGLFGGSMVPRAGLRFGTSSVSRQTNEALRPSDGNPEVIGWPVGLVLTNALMISIRASSEIVGNPKTISAPDFLTIACRMADVECRAAAQLVTTLPVPKSIASTFLAASSCMCGST